MLALYGERLRPEPSAPVPPAQQKLAALHAQREHLVAGRAVEKTRLQQTTERWVGAQIARALGFLTREIAKLEAQIEALIAADPALEKKSSASIRPLASLAWGPPGSWPCCQNWAP